MTSELFAVKSEEPFDNLTILLSIFVKFDNVVSDRVRIIFQWVFFVSLCQLVDIFGTMKYIINIICFDKQGVKDPVNISLLGLAISDLCSLVPLILSNIFFNPTFNEMDLNFDPTELQYLTGAWIHGIFSRVTSWITAFIILERCLCITMPLKVRSILTPKRATIAIITIFVILLATISPLYYTNRYAYKFSSRRNKTIIGLVFTPDRENIARVLFALNNIVIPGSAFLIVIVCTIILVVSLKFKTQWRKKSASSVNVYATSSRHQKVTKMTNVISTLFIVCYLPLCTIVVAVIVESEMSIDGVYKNTLVTVIGVSFFLESDNSASNIFIYYFMSSRYRSAFRQLFKMKQ